MLIKRICQIIISITFFFCTFAVLAAETEHNPITIKEWPVPFQGQPRDPFATNNNEVWFVGQAGHYLGRFTPATGEFFRKDLDDQSGPHNLIVSDEGIVWFSGNLKGYMGRFDPQQDQITRIAMPDPEAKDPHTLVFDDSQEHIWFTVQWGNFVGRLSLQDSRVDLMPVPTSRARPYGIKIAPNGTPWAVLLGTNKLVNVNPETLALLEVEIPNKAARPRRLEITDDGRIWYSDYGTGVLGLYDPASGIFREWPLPGGADARPYGTALDSQGVVWVVTGTKPNYFVGFDTAKEHIISVTAVPSGGGTVRHMHYLPSSNAIWFGTDTQNIGKAEVNIK